MYDGINLEKRSRAWDISRIWQQGTNRKGKQYQTIFSKLLEPAKEWEYSRPLKSN